MDPRERGDSMNVDRLYRQKGDSVASHFFRQRFLPSVGQTQFPKTLLDTDFPVAGYAEEELV